MGSENNERVKRSLNKSKVIIAGAGAVGSNAALYLARAGVGHIKVVDFDVVDEENITTHQYFRKHIGMKKVDALKEIISNIDYGIKVEAIDRKIEKENVKEIFDDADIVLEALNDVKYKAVIINEVLNKFENVKVISALGMAGFYSGNMIKTKKIKDRLYMCGDDIYRADINEGLMAPRLAIAASQQANMAIRLLLGEEDV